MAHAPKPRTADEVAATRRKLARLLALGALRAVEADRAARSEPSSGTPVATSE